MILTPCWVFFYTLHIARLFIFPIKLYIAIVEIKVILYIIGGILYFLYTVGKKVQEKQKSAIPTGKAAPPKPITPPDYNRDKEKRRIESAAQKSKQVAQPVNVVQQPARKSYYDIQGNEEAANRTVPDIVEVMKTPVKSDADGDIPYEFDARQAFIGSIIFERKY